MFLSCSVTLNASSSFCIVLFSRSKLFTAILVIFQLFKIAKMPLVSALRAWLAMVPAIALAPDTRLEIAVIDGRLDVIKTKKPKKVS